MKHSIRFRFTMIFVGLTAVLLVGIWCVNNWLLEDFYINEKVAVLQRAYEDMDKLVMEKVNAGSSISQEIEDNTSIDSGEQTSAVRLLRTLNDQYNIMMVIVDSVNDRAIVSSSRDGQFLVDKARGYILGYSTPGTEILKEADNYTVQKTFDVRSKSFYLESWGYYSDNSTIFIMSTPLASIRESVALSNRFLAYVGMAALLLISVVMYFATKKVTSPILELSNLSEKMSDLDFEAKYTGTAEDEIGTLGNSMNVLSDKLKETIGALKSANNELQQDIEQKIQVDEMRKDFIANVSHELKTPIALIQGYAEGLTEGMCEDEESRNYYCEVIMDEANKMNQMVRQLLTLTALEFGKDTAVLERFDLVELLRDMIASSQILIRQKNATVEFEPRGSIYVWADEFKIEEVITNYLSNALHHLAGENRIIIRTVQEEGKVRVSVFNTGMPIPEEDLTNIWLKFYKVDKAHSRAYGGSGIGLSIVKAIMDSHHQTCGVSNWENGVEFWFTLDTKME
ncbi:MAG: HAMP domain-containing sensor histidine kinase [Hungatella sp.]